MTGASGDTTRVLARASRGDARAAKELIPLVYADLKKRAVGFFRGERADHTLQPTALVNEAYLRLVDQSRVDWKGRTHFLAVAALQMRRILVDHAKAQDAVKRGRDWVKVNLDDARLSGEDRDVGVLDLEEALEELARLNERQAQLIELRFFAGLTVKETAQFLGIATATVEKDWRMARAWLRRRLGESKGA